MRNEASPGGEAARATRVNVLRTVCQERHIAKFEPAADHLDVAVSDC